MTADKQSLRKAGFAYLAAGLVLLLLAVTLFVLSGYGPYTLDREKGFMTVFGNSLYHLDLAKQQWAEEKHKSERAVPTMEDVMPYLGNWTNTIKRFVALGIDYKITSTENPQSDVATLTHDLRFRKGFCRYYQAGTSYGLQKGWDFPNYDSTSSFEAFCINNRELLTLVFGMSGLGTLLVFAIKRIRISKQEKSNPRIF